MVNAANVKIWGHFVGAIRWDDREKLGYFEFSKDFISKNLDLAPIKMPISNGARIYSFPELRKGRADIEDTFKGLPGMLADLLPDKYGNRLIDEWLVRNDRAPGSMNPVEKLCFIGSRGMGALEFEPAQITKGEASFSLEIDHLVEIAKAVLNQRSDFRTNLKNEEQAVLDLLKIGTSAGGARPKAVIAYNSKTGAIKSGQASVENGFEHWLIKLDGVSGAQFGESSGWGRVEYAYYLMARDAGIEISESRLFEENGRAHFMTKRFDRDGNQKHHTQTLCGIQHYDFNDMFGYSYEQVFHTMRSLKLSYAEAEEMFRRMVFNVIATNYDDHTKNFSFLLKKNGSWKLAPAYDLCFAYDATNQWVSQQTLSVNGKRNSIKKEDFLQLAEKNNIKNPNAIINEVNEVVSSWDKYAKQAKVRSDLSQRITENLNIMQ